MINRRYLDILEGKRVNVSQLAFRACYLKVRPDELVTAPAPATERYFSSADLDKNGGERNANRVATNGAE